MKKITTLILAVAGLSVSFAAEQAFIRTDTNQDGKISRAEYAESLKQRFKVQGKEGYAEAAEVQFKRKDKNKDGFLDEEEFAIKAKRIKFQEDS